MGDGDIYLERLCTCPQPRERYEANCPIVVALINKKWVCVGELEMYCVASYDAVGCVAHYIRMSGKFPSYDGNLLLPTDAKMNESEY